MAAFELGETRTGRVWREEFPDVSYPVIQVVEHTLETTPSLATQQKQAVVELLVFSGGRIQYGLLGATFQPNAAHRLAIEIAVSEDMDEDGNNNPQIFEQSLASDIDQVVVGLPLEYINGVSAGILDTKNIQYLGAGVLRFNQAAYGLSGSSRAMFRLLSRAIIVLFAADVHSGADEGMKALQEALSLPL